MSTAPCGRFKGNDFLVLSPVKALLPVSTPLATVTTERCRAGHDLFRGRHHSGKFISRTNAGFGKPRLTRSRHRIAAHLGGRR